MTNAMTPNAILTNQNLEPLLSIDEVARQESTAEERRTGRAQKNQSAKQLSARFEDFVDADRAAEFLSIDRETVIRWARNGTMPGHPLGAGRRRVWRFRFSELSNWAGSQVQSGYRPCSEG